MLILLLWLFYEKEKKLGKGVVECFNQEERRKKKSEVSSRVSAFGFEMPRHPHFRVSSNISGFRLLD